MTDVSTKNGKGPAVWLAGSGGRAVRRTARCRPVGAGRTEAGRARGLAAIALVALGFGATPSRAADPVALFREAVRHELDGGGTVEQAFLLYRQAAQAGLADAEFNVAAMYDSGRGVERDVAQAATWYARAATRGNQRAAYNLGQLYEAGEGVPTNVDLARSWFAASDLAAARDRLAAPRPHVVSAAAVLTAPVPVAPASGAAVVSASGGLELVWTSPAQPEPVRFFVEVRALDARGSHEVFSGFTDTSGLLATPPDPRGPYAWRVLAVAREAGRYAASPWQRFSVAPD